MHRFFVLPTTINGDHAHIKGETAHQIARVLRMQPGDRITLLNGQGFEYIVTLLNVGKDDVTGRVESSAEGKSEPRHRITLYLSLLNKADKFEWALQKCTELGASAFVPVRSTRSISDTPGSAKIERWQRIIQEAAEQSGRSSLPALDETLTLQDAFKAEANKPAIIPALEAHTTLRKTISDLKHAGQANISIFIGPEGGFTPEELQEATSAKVQPVTLGPRILRAETAAVAALTMTLYELGEMDATLDTVSTMPS